MLSWTRRELYQTHRTPARAWNSGERLATAYLSELKISFGLSMPIGLSMPKWKHITDIRGFCPLRHGSGNEMRAAQFHQDQCASQAKTETRVCHCQKYFDNLKKYLPKTAVCMVWYKCNSFLVDMDNCCSQLNYTTNQWGVVLFCLRKKPVIMRVLAFRNRLYFLFR